MIFNDCPGCGREDLGWEMSDVRETLYISHCRCEPTCQCTDEDRREYDPSPDFDGCICEDNGCDCDRTVVKVVIRREFDQVCHYCDGPDYRCLWDVTLDNSRVRSFDSEEKARDYVRRVFPSAEPPEYDAAWESERFLRQAEGWGC